MKKIPIIMLAVIWLLLANYALAVEPSVQVEVSDIEVSDNLKITDIKSTFEMKKEGEEENKVVVEFAIQNVGSTSAQFIIFASVAEEKGWSTEGSSFQRIRNLLLKKQQRAKLRLVMLKTGCRQ